MEAGVEGAGRMEGAGRFGGSVEEGKSKTINKTHGEHGHESSCATVFTITYCN